ncbi:MAG: phosphoribosyl 1,2-cyclic phosphodiesterase [Gammaproteobacteria bacterium]|jgi:phosphoribosyl 1,2-cyclic phosphodiesterase
MQIASLGSGSKGNGTLLRCSDTLLLIDCGFSVKQCMLRLERLQIEPDQLDAILVTHEHSDHCSGVRKLAQRFSIPVWATMGTLKKGLENDCQVSILHGDNSIQIGSFLIQPVTVPHDAGEPVQFIFQEASGKRFGILTDTGHITRHIVSAYRDLDGLLLEFNYDDEMLESGPYPFTLKQRVSGDLGHLSNQQSMGLLREINLLRLNHLIAAHLSEKNNSVDIVTNAISSLDIAHKIVADQQQGFGWISI